MTTTVTVNTDQNPSGQMVSIQGILFAASTALLAELILGLSFARREFILSTGRFAITFLSLFVIYRFAVSSLRAFKNYNTRNLITLNLVLIGSTVILWMSRVVAIGVSMYAIQSNVTENLFVEALAFGTPYSTGILILQAILGLQFSFIASVCLALLCGVYFPAEPILIPYVICTSLVASLSLVRFRSRSAYIRAGFNVSLVSIPLALASCLLVDHVSLIEVFVRVGGALAGGVIAAFLAAGITPLCEYLGGYVTDMRLIELATLDHPLLKEISLSAPGTWNHSMVMGMMAEAAADAVGANPILVRVGAYYHDIGKMKKPLYFVENQMGDENRHDKLSTSMSALIIKSHVKDGLELGKKYTLPGGIMDAIAQHHGTSIIEYFYEKALKEAKEAGQDPAEVDKSLYTYPGPKPQTKEAGILMLADGIEAAARTLSDHSTDRIQGMVQKLINKVFASGELDECELTLQDLHNIARAFTRVLTGIYHQRIAYAEPAEKVKDPELRQENSVAVAPKTLPDHGDKKTTDEAPKEQKEDLKRLGM